MTINEYQTEALRTAAGMNHPNNDEILLNGVMGLCGESGECVDMIKKYRFQGHELDKAHLAKELGDVAWYLAVTAHAIGYDLCKMDNYQHPVVAETLGGEEIRDDSKWEYAMDTLLKGHGDKSVMVLAQYFKLTEEEIMCIRYHMGAFCDKSEWNDYTRAVHKYTNVLWTHQADMLASHVEGV